jgi:hypothetical protein
MSPIDEGPSLEQMRAFLMSQGVFPQNAAFDDGASLLGQNPDMQQVGFKIPKISKVLDIPHNPGRRNMGLTLPKQDNQSVVGPQSQFAQTLTKEREAAKAPVAPQAPTVSPLEFAAEAIKNMPMTRRQVLQTPLNAAVSHYGRKLAGPMESVVEPAAAAVPEVAEAAFVRNPVFDDYLQDYASTYLFDSAVNEPYEASLTAYDFMRDYLQDRVPKSKLDKYESVYDKVRNNQDEDGNFIDESFKAETELENIVHDNLKYLRPDEVQDLLDNMQQYQSTSSDFASDVLNNLSNAGEEEAAKHYKDLVKYLDDAWKQK